MFEVLAVLMRFGVENWTYRIFFLQIEHERGARYDSGRL